LQLSAKLIAELLQIFSQKKSENGTWCCKALGLEGDPYGALIEFGKNSGII